DDRLGNEFQPGGDADRVVVDHKANDQARAAEEEKQALRFGLDALDVEQKAQREAEDEGEEDGNPARGRQRREVNAARTGFVDETEAATEHDGPRNQRRREGRRQREDDKRDRGVFHGPALTRSAQTGRRLEVVRSRQREARGQMAYLVG